MVKFAEFGVEAWLNRWEKQARYDISQSTIASMTLAELFQLTGDDLPSFLATAAQTPENYGWIEGSKVHRILKRRLPSCISSFRRPTLCKPMG